MSALLALIHVILKEPICFVGETWAGMPRVVRASCRGSDRVGGRRPAPAPGDSGALYLRCPPARPSKRGPSALAMVAPLRPVPWCRRPAPAAVFLVTRSERRAQDPHPRAARLWRFRARSLAEPLGTRRAGDAAGRSGRLARAQPRRLARDARSPRRRLRRAPDPGRP